MAQLLQRPSHQREQMLAQILPLQKIPLIQYFEICTYFVMEANGEVIYLVISS